MAVSPQGHKLLNLVLLLNRCSLGLYFFLAGMAKLGRGVGKFYKEGFAPMKPIWLPDWFALPYGHALPFVEVLLGAALVLGLYGRAAAALASLALASFTIAIYEAGLFIPERGGPFHYNVIFLTLAMLLAVLGPGSLSVDAFRRGGGASGR